VNVSTVEEWTMSGRTTKKPKDIAVPSTERRRELGNDAELLDLYIDDLSRTPTISAEEQKKLARIMRDTKRPTADREEARAALVRANLRFAFSIAKRYQHRGVALEDLVGEANAGLLHAAEKYDPDVGVNFISYAVWWIRQSLAASIARTGHVMRLPANRASDHTRVLRGAEVLRQTFGREGTDEELAELTGLTLDTVRSLRNLTLTASSLDEPIGDDRRGGGRTLGQTVAAAAAAGGASGGGSDGDDLHDPERFIEDESRRAALSRVLDILPPRDRRVIVRYFGLEGNHAATLSEIATELGVTRERVRQLRDRALERLRCGEAERLRGEWAA
jgi:RNA polymerase primary sigma factor